MIVFPLRHHLESQALENAHDLIRIRAAAENSTHLGNAKRDRRLIELTRNHVDRVAHRFATAGSQNQFGDAIARRNSRLEVSSALKTMRGIGVQAVASRHLPHGNRVPPRRLDQDIARLLRDHGVESAHGASKTNGLLRVCDDQVFRC